MEIVLRTPSLTARPVTSIVTATLNQLSAVSKSQREFAAALLATILALRGRVNYRNLARYGRYSERTYARQFESPPPWFAYHAQIIQSILPTIHELVAAHDASFIPKSGQQTSELGHFYNGYPSHPERGLEISAIAVVDVTQKGASVASVEQSLPTLQSETGQTDPTQLDQAIT